MKLYESIKTNLKEAELDNPVLQEIYDNLQAGISYGEDMDKEHHSWVTYPYFDEVLYLIANNGVGREVIGWKNYGSSANPNTIKDLNWIITEIFKMTPEEFTQKYIKSTDSKLMESESTALKEATGTKKFFITKFEDNADRNGEEVEIVNYKDNGRLDIKFVSDGKLLKNVYDTEVKRVTYNVDGDNIRMIASDLGEYQDKIINYIKSLKETEMKKESQTQEIEGVLETLKEKNPNIEKYLNEYYKVIADTEPKPAYDKEKDRMNPAWENWNRTTNNVLYSREAWENFTNWVKEKYGENLNEAEEINEYQVEVDNCLNAYNNKDLETTYKAWCKLHEILDNKLDAAGPKDEDRFPLYSEWQSYIDKIPRDAMYEITDYGKNKIYAEEYGLKETEGSRLLGGRYRTMSELRDLFKEYADYFETKGTRIKGNTPEDSYNRGWELGKADAYKLAAFEIENNVDPSLLSEATNLDMNTTSLYIDINELAKYAELYLQEKLGYANVYKESGKQYTYMVAIRRDDDSVDKYIKLQEGLFNESETLNEGNYGKLYLAEVLMDGTVGTCRGIGHTPEEAKENAFKLFKQDYGDNYIQSALLKTMLKTTDEQSLANEEKTQQRSQIMDRIANGEYTDNEALNAVETYYGINVFDMSSGATNEGGSTLKESAGYNDKLGGDPEDFISDIQSIKAKLNELDTNKFATKLAYEIWEQFLDACDYKISLIKDIFLNESYNYIGKDTGKAGRSDKSHMEHIYTVYDCFGEVDTFKSKEDAEKYIEEHKDDEMYTEEYGCSNGPEFRIEDEDIEVNNKKIVIKDDLEETENLNAGGSDQWSKTGKVILNGLEIRDYLKNIGGFEDYINQIDDNNAMYQLTDLDKGKFEFKKLPPVKESEEKKLAVESWTFTE